MFFLLRESGGLGLAAPQVGIDARLFITIWDDIFIDPVIVRQHRRYELGGLPEPAGSHLPAAPLQDHPPRGRAAGFYDLKAAVIQHECDHLNGRLITDHRGQDNA